MKGIFVLAACGAGALRVSVGAPSAKERAAQDMMRSLIKQHGQATKTFFADSVCLARGALENDSSFVQVEAASNDAQTPAAGNDVQAAAVGGDNNLAEIVTWNAVHNDDCFDMLCAVAADERGYQWWSGHHIVAECGNAGRFMVAGQKIQRGRDQRSKLPKAREEADAHEATVNEIAAAKQADIEAAKVASQQNVPTPSKQNVVTPSKQTVPTPSAQNTPTPSAKNSAAASTNADEEGSSCGGSSGNESNENEATKNEEEAAA